MNFHIYNLSSFACMSSYTKCINDYKKFTLNYQSAHLNRSAVVPFYHYLANLLQEKRMHNEAKSKIFNGKGSPPCHMEALPHVS